MQIVGEVESLWRYPVKSMRGEQLACAFAGFPGIYGDRVFAFRSSAAHAGFPFLTGREQQQMLRYRPAYRNPSQTIAPPNLADAEALSPNIAPVYAQPPSMMVDVEAPSGQAFAIDAPELFAELRHGLKERHELTLLRSDRPMVDCRPISLISLQSVQRLGEECKTEMDKRRFRANIYLNLNHANSENSVINEDRFVGHTLQIGPKVLIAVLERDPRCKMITLDPGTGDANPGIMQHVARTRDGKIGIYAAVLIEGAIRPGDPILLRD